MRSLEDILNESENLQSQIDRLLEKVNNLQKVTFKNIIFNQEKNINRILFQVHHLQGRVEALLWVLNK